MLKKFPYLMFCLILLTACDNTKPIAKTPVENSSNDATTSQAASTVLTTSNPASSAPVQTLPLQKLTPEGKILVDWKAVDSGTPAIPPSEFKYPFALDSIPVKNYMNVYHVDAKTAQHNLTIGMATNEALSKLLDQIDTSYVSHELTAGKGSKLIVHTTPKVIPSEHDYIIEDPFAKGLILPIQLIPDGQKTTHGENPH